jgi:hypothetical protein
MPSYFLQRCVWCGQFNRVPEPYARPAVACVQCGHQVGVALTACVCQCCVPMLAAQAREPVRAELAESASVAKVRDAPPRAANVRAARLGVVSAEELFWRSAECVFNQARPEQFIVERGN